MTGKQAHNPLIISMVKCLLITHYNIIYPNRRPKKT